MGTGPPEPIKIFPFKAMTFPFHVKAFDFEKPSYLMGCQEAAPGHWLAAPSSHGKVALALLMELGLCAT